jgi:ribosomal protein L21
MLTLKYKTGGQYNIKRGHRQNYTSVEVSDIQIS